MPGIKYIIVCLWMFAGLMACNKDSDHPETLDCNLQSAEYQTSLKSDIYLSLIKQYTAKGLPGISLLVHDSSGYFIGSSGTADIANNIPLQPCHIQHFGGVTQMLTATAIFRLQERGVLSIDDLVSDYLPSGTLKKIENGDSPLRIRNLLNHTAGLYDIFSNQQFDFDLINNPTVQKSADQLLDYVYGQPSTFVFRPADTVGFSNTNYLLLGMIIEKATGVPVSKVITDEIIVPLGLNETYCFPYQQPPINQLANGYYDLYGTNTLHNLGDWNTGFGNGYNGVFSTVWDMHLFLEALFISKTLLQPASLDQMLQFEPDVEKGKQMGLGCFRDFLDTSNPENKFSWGYRGNDLATTAEIHYFPESKTTLVIALNYGTAKTSSLRYAYEELRRKIAAIIRD
jgi:D-alanyl-D-alanine carboxypeptidase